MLLLSAFSGVALVLAAIGVFGVMANSVSQRTHEIGIRMALGASPKAIQKMIVLQATTMALLGIGVGLIASISLTRFISSLLYNVSTTDPTVFEFVALALTLVLIAASYIPARRATAVAPTTVLRNG
jgi:putative ABC transport system permease protein